MEDKLYAVITGDIYKSSRFSGEKRTSLLAVLKKAFQNVDRVLGDDVMGFPFDIFRGDSFQGVITDPAQALKVAIIIRATARSFFKTTLKNAVDARIAIGLGTIDYMPKTSTGEGDGDAFRNSGPVLDSMAKHSRMLLIKTPFKSLNDEFNVECALLDAIIAKWSPEQALTVIEILDNKTQEEMAGIFNISQPAVKKRIDASNFFALQLMMLRYNQSFTEQKNKYKL